MEAIFYRKKSKPFMGMFVFFFQVFKKKFATLLIHHAIAFKGHGPHHDQDNSMAPNIEVEFYMIS